MRTFLLALALLSLPAPAAAQDYPTRPIRVIATSSAGGTSDIFMRALGEELHKRLGQPLIVENRPGGAFNIGARACAEAAPDGYTICIIPGEPLVFSQFMFKTLQYDPTTAFEPITQLFFITQALVVSAALNVRTLPELAALSKAKPATLSYSTAAIPAVVFMERWKKQTGADLVKVPFRGGGEAVAALLDRRHAGRTLRHRQHALAARGRQRARPRCRQRRALAVVSGHPDHSGGVGPEIHLEILFRPDGAGRHAEADRRQAPRRGRAHRRRARVPATAI